MNQSSKSVSAQRSIPILLVDDNPDHHLLIGYSIRQCMPQAYANFAHTVDSALDYLERCAWPSVEFPRLVLLDLLVPSLDEGWIALTRIRARYPRLPVLILSAVTNPDLVDKAYDLGAYSFLGKPTGLEQWEELFRRLNLYWFDTVTLSTSSPAQPD